MMAKDSVQKRLETGISFTEFSYQLVQGYDFYFLYQTKGVKIQAGGSDQWGNIVTGTEFIRRKVGGEAYAFTCPLITKADGSKFGKSEQGNVWLDANLTSPYHFYQFWLNVADADAARYIKIFTFLPLDEIAELERQHTEAPHLRILQKALAEDITVRVHSREDYEQAVEASDILFGKGTTESLARLPENVFTSVFEGVPQFTVAKADLEAGINVLDLLAVNTTIFPSKGEARKMLIGGGVGINKTKLEDAEVAINTTRLLNNRYLLIQKGKKNYYLIIVN
jgi:tyrosyl-tRNA synthetase